MIVATAATAVPVAIVTVARARIAAPGAMARVVIVMIASARRAVRAPKQQQPPVKEHLNNEW